MLDNAAESVKRFAPPPPSRNRSLNRRKPGDRYDKVNYSTVAEGEKSQPPYPKAYSVSERGESAVKMQSERNPSRLIPLEGCSISEAAELLQENWATTVRLLDDPSIDASERPVVYSGASASSWVHLKLPHQMDFLGELRRAIDKANKSESTTSNDG